nr:SDR family oxidoreductase [Halomicroarcula nitratireducens]
MQGDTQSNVSDHADSRLAGRHIVVTGAARGIGRGIAQRMYSRRRERLDFRYATREGDGDVDVSEEASVIAGVEAAAAELGEIHGLVDNAGIQRSVPLLETSAEEWDRQFAVNARGTFLVAKRVAEQMIADGVEGSIVNVSSVGAERPFRGQGAYGASKAAVRTLTTVLAKELSDHGITANAIKPGTVETPRSTGGYRSCRRVAPLRRR